MPSNASRHFPLYDPRFDSDSCGTGFVARVSGEPSHEIIHLALNAVSRLEHRGAVAADGMSGDGAGVLTEIPRSFFAREAARLGHQVAPDEPLAVGQVFLPPGDDTTQSSLEQALLSRGLLPLGWRDVPIDRDQLGDFARSTCPDVRQILVRPSAGQRLDVFERELYLARKAFERDMPRGYVCSLSARQLVYKALCAPHQLPRVLPDLADPEYATAFALFHQRFSTNTLPAWAMAQPLRLLAHNGEINTLWGNRAWVRCREHELPNELRPALPEGASDSANLDAVLELLARNGRDVLHALAMLLVPSWEDPAADLDPDVVAFCRYHASLMEPWEGPAAIVFADGRFVGAALDRNGLRPCRYAVTRHGLVVAGSEVGLVDLPPEDVIERGRLGPGQVIAIDLDERRLIRDEEIKRRIASQRPYAQWLPARAPSGAASVPRGTDALIADPEALARWQGLYGFTHEALRIFLTPMAENGTSATWSMGDDTPIPPLAQQPRSLYEFFRQRFAQVTNPAIDPLREACVMSLTTWLGPRPPLLTDGPQPPVLELESPVLSLPQLEHLRHQAALPVATVPCVFSLDPHALESAIDAVCADARSAVRGGASILILTDRPVSTVAAPIPMALVVGAVHRDLVEAGLRTRVGLVVETGDCFDVHHVAVLIGYGAGAVCPWMTLAGARAVHGTDGETRTIEALSSGLRKVMSKMGVSTVGSYRGGQLFDALGLSPEVVARCFNGTVSPIGGLGFVAIAQTVLDRHGTWASPTTSSGLPDRGFVRFRRGGEHHAWSPTTVRALQRAVGSEKRPKDGSPSAADWQAFRAAAKADFPTDVRGLLELVPAGPPGPIDDVEPAESIVRRFATSAMSLGALSPEAHRTLSIAMNRLGAKSNTGEGGEDPEQYAPADGERADSKVKQVASGRFGVTAEYLAHAEEIEIKIAQGSKPGEGGQLPGHKVTDLIARLRHASAGVSLISPPPHHDIYSIEDLAQLIYDLKRVNPGAKVAVKLVAEAGVGTIAAGVAKAHADYVVISGHSGGTGASPLSSIKHAGTSWELGLAEIQQVLIRNRLRERVGIRADGGFRSASDILIAAALGADEYGFGTAPLVAMGCDMARQCHLNTCPTGIATQRPELRAKFRGTPEQVVRYFLSLAQDVREALARLGLRAMDDLIGRVDLLRQGEAPRGLDLSALLAAPGGGTRRRVAERNDRLESDPIDEAIVAPALRAAELGLDFRARLSITNRDRSVGARVAGALALRWGLDHPGSTVDIRCTGSAGQSFGAFATPGMRLTLVGEANDYVGKGLSGGVLVVRPIAPGTTASDRHAIMGNVVLYGATGGQLFAAGRAGERFAIRNSGALAVVEGAGDHCCEYMTGGMVVVLGECGVNFGAGMTGGTAYVLDHAGGFPARVNPGHVTWLRCPSEEWDLLEGLIRRHLAETDSGRARQLLGDWRNARTSFWKVVPNEGAERSREATADSRQETTNPAVV